MDQFPSSAYLQQPAGADMATMAPSVMPEPGPAPQPEPAPVQAGPKRLDPAALRARRQREAAGYDFVLRATTDEDGNPTVARVRRPDIFDADEIGKLPQHMQHAIFRLIEEAEAQEGKTPGATVEESVVDLLARNYASFATLADAYVIAGFIEPRVYATAAEADTNGGVWVKDIERADRMAFYHHCTGMRTEAAESLTNFRDRPADDVDAGPARQTVPGQPAEHAPGAPTALPAPGV